MRIIALLAVIIAALSYCPMPASAETRVALVIGNSKYQNVSFLPNPVNDSADIAAALKRLGFDVRTLTDAKYDDMRRALLEFDRRATGSDIAVVFFAGHGMEVGGQNWLIPVDAELSTDTAAENEAISLRTLVEKVGKARQLGLVILDACRNNPFAAKMALSSYKRSVDRGFSRIEPSGNVLVAYAAKDGTTANDGSGRNSPFTAALLQNIEAPNVEIEMMFRLVRDEVIQSTKGEQLPFKYGSLSGQAIYLKRITQETNAPAAPTQVVNPAARPAGSVVAGPQGSSGGGAQVAGLPPVTNNLNRAISFKITGTKVFLTRMDGEGSIRNINRSWEDDPKVLKKEKIDTFDYRKDMAVRIKGREVMFDWGVDAPGKYLIGCGEGSVISRSDYPAVGGRPISLKCKFETEGLLLRVYFTVIAGTSPDLQDLRREESYIRNNNAFYEENKFEFAFQVSRDSCELKQFRQDQYISGITRGKAKGVQLLSSMEQTMVWTMDTGSCFAI